MPVEVLETRSPRRAMHLDGAEAPAVLVTDGEQRAALAVVRSLGRAGYRPFVCSTRRRSLAGASRFAASQAIVPDALSEPAAFAAELARLVRQWGIQVLLPISEPSLLAVLDSAELYPGVGEGDLDATTFRRICDKGALLAAAETVGIAVPAQNVVSSVEEIETLAPGSLDFPVVIKPARSVGEGDTGRVKVAVGYAADAAELREKLHAIPAAAYPVLLQQRIVGPGIGIFLLRWDGETRAVFAHRRIREKPPSGGVSVYRESIPADPELVQRSLDLLDGFDWRGVAMVEYKVDSRTGIP